MACVCVTLCRVNKRSNCFYLLIGGLAMFLASLVTFRLNDTKNELRLSESGFRPVINLPLSTPPLLLSVLGPPRLASLITPVSFGCGEALAVKENATRQKRERNIARKIMVHWRYDHQIPKLSLPVRILLRRQRRNMKTVEDMQRIIAALFKGTQMYRVRQKSLNSLKLNCSIFFS